MDDFLFYLLLGAFLAGVLIAAVRDAPRCLGDCGQGDRPCNCRMLSHEFRDVNGFRYEWVNGNLNTKGLTMEQIAIGERNTPSSVWQHRRNCARR